MRDKARDIARSLLPCKNREAARRDKAKVHRTERRGAREELSYYEGRLDREVERELIEEECVPTTRPGIDYRVEIASNVMVRRWGDKLGPFLRWARAKTRTLRDPRRKLARVKKLLGASTLITEHALGHFLDRRDLDPHYYSAWRYTRRITRAWPDLACLTRLLHRAFDAHHGELNAFLKAAREPVVQTRADIDKLARDVWSLDPGAHLARALSRFLARTATG